MGFLQNSATKQSFSRLCRGFFNVCTRVAHVTQFSRLIREGPDTELIALWD